MPIIFEPDTVPIFDLSATYDNKKEEFIYQILILSNHNIKPGDLFSTRSGVPHGNHFGMIASIESNRFDGSRVFGVFEWDGLPLARMPNNRVYVRDDVYVTNFFPLRQHFPDENYDANKHLLSKSFHTRKWIFPTNTTKEDMVAINSQMGNLIASDQLPATGTGLRLVKNAVFTKVFQNQEEYDFNNEKTFCLRFCVGLLNRRPSVRGQNPTNSKIPIDQVGLVLNDCGALVSLFEVVQRRSPQKYTLPYCVRDVVVMQLKNTLKTFTCHDKNPILNELINKIVAIKEQLIDIHQNIDSFQNTIKELSCQLINETVQFNKHLVISRNTMLDKYYEMHKECYSHSQVKFERHISSLLNLTNLKNKLINSCCLAPGQSNLQSPSMISEYSKYIDEYVNLRNRIDNSNSDEERVEAQTKIEQLLVSFHENSVYFLDSELFDKRLINSDILEIGSNFSGLKTFGFEKKECIRSINVEQTFKLIEHFNLFANNDFRKRNGVLLAEQAQKCYELFLKSHLYLTRQIDTHSFTSLVAKCTENGSGIQMVRHFQYSIEHEKNIDVSPSTYFLSIYTYSCIRLAAEYREYLNSKNSQIEERRALLEQNYQQIDDSILAIRQNYQRDVYHWKNDIPQLEERRRIELSKIDLHTKELNALRKKLDSLNIEKVALEKNLREIPKDVPEDDSSRKQIQEQLLSNQNDIKYHISTIESCRNTIESIIKDEQQIANQIIGTNNAITCTLRLAEGRIRQLTERQNSERAEFDNYCASLGQAMQDPFENATISELFRKIFVSSGSSIIPYPILKESNDERLFQHSENLFCFFNAELKRHIATGVEPSVQGRRIEIEFADNQNSRIIAQPQIPPIEANQMFVHNSISASSD